MKLGTKKRMWKPQRSSIRPGTLQKRKSQRKTKNSTANFLIWRNSGTNDCNLIYFKFQKGIRKYGF